MIRALRVAATSGLALLLTGLVLTLAGSVAPVASAWALRNLVDALQRPSGSREPILMAVLVAVTAALAALLPAGSDLLARRLAGLMKVREHDDLFRAVNRKEDMSSFDDPEFHANLTLARERGIEASGDVVSGGLDLLLTVVMSLGFVTALFAVSPPLVAAALFAAMPLLLVERSLGRVRLSSAKEFNAFSRELFLYSQAMAGYREAKEVRLLGIGGFLRSRARSRFTSAVNAEHRLARREFAMSLASILIGLGFSLGILVWAVTRYRGGDLSLGDLTVVAAAGAGIIQGVTGSVAHLGRLRHSLNVQQVLQDLLAAVALDPPEALADLPPLESAIEIKDVSFRYPGQDRWAVEHVNLRIASDQMVAMVGANGSGKTTLTKLICRLYEPAEGAVLWNGVDLRVHSHASLRRCIGVLFQDFVIYEFSAAENIGIGDVTRTESALAIEKAAMLSGAHTMIERLPRGYATRLTRMYPDPGDETAAGVVLSGGQSQRVTIARLLMRSEVDLLILDEPTAGLDPDAEAELLNTLRQHRTGKATIFITHRLGAARTADLIVVVADGTVVEQGRHEELMARGGEYARLYGLQAAGYAAATEECPADR